MGHQITYSHPSVQKEINSWPSEIRAKYAHITEAMCQENPNLGRPYTKPVRKKLFEIRINKKHRVLFKCNGQEIRLLHAFVKRENQISKPDIDVALSRE